MTLDAPASIDALVAIVAGTAPGPIRIAGARTKRPDVPLDGDAPAVLDLRALSGIVAYDPAECVVTVLAGTPVADVASTLAAHGQHLPWDPPFTAAGATVGGMVAAGVNGSGRYRYGGVRDFVIGARVVDGRGRLIASGGQVVKNAAGFLTHHALVGSAGRLGVIVEVSLKVFPAPDAHATLVARGTSLAGVLAAHERLRQANLDLEALDVDVAAPAVRVRLAGAADALPDRTARAADVLGLPSEHLSGPDDARLWDAAAAFAWAPSAATLVKVPCVPTRVAATLAVLGPFGPCAVACGGSVAYVATDGGADELGAALARHDARGAVVRGAACGTLVGAGSPDPFGARVQAALDPDRRFR